LFTLSKKLTALFTQDSLLNTHHQIKACPMSSIFLIDELSTYATHDLFANETKFSSDANAFKRESLSSIL
jgi:hypothetical protein